jgi:hypothetical protein
LRFKPPPKFVTPRGISVIEGRVVQQLPQIIHEVLAVDTRRYLVSVLVVRVSSDRRQITVQLGLRFLPGSPFCCMEPGCHLGLFDLREIGMNLARGVGLPASAELVIENIESLTEGAEFLDPCDL